MGFAPGPGGGNSSIAGSTDVSLDNVANDQVLGYDSTSSKWQNKQVAVQGATTWDEIENKPDLEALPYMPIIAGAKQAVIFQSVSPSDSRPTDLAAVSVTWLTDYPEQPHNFISGDIQFEVGEAA